LPRIVNLVSDQFGFYHVGIFLNDEIGEYAVLTAANSPGGKRLLAKKHRLAIGKVGIVGDVASTGRPHIALDTGEDAIYFDNPDLPETHSEMALPLKSSKNIIGALDVQSKLQNAFSDEDIGILSILAELISIAIENTRLFESTRQSLEEAETVYSQYLRRDWARLVGERQLTGFRYSLNGVTSLDKPVSGPEIRKVLETGETFQKPVGEQGAGSQLTLPIKVRGETIGVLNINAPGDYSWNEDQVDMVKSISDRLAISIENARLIEETTRRADRERNVSDISTKIRSVTDPQSMLVTAVEELKKIFGTGDIQIKPYDVHLSGQPADSPKHNPIK
jgi:GAF domain-containing protein